jgi:hypothetical protein
LPLESGSGSLASTPLSSSHSTSICLCGGPTISVYASGMEMRPNLTNQSSESPWPL